MEKKWKSTLIRCSWPMMTEVESWTEEEDPLGPSITLHIAPSCCLAIPWTPRCLECGSFPHTCRLSMPKSAPVEERVSSSPVVEEPRDLGFGSIDSGGGKFQRNFFSKAMRMQSASGEGASIDFGSAMMMTKLLTSEQHPGVNPNHLRAQLLVSDDQIELQSTGYYPQGGWTTCR